MMISMESAFEAYLRNVLSRNAEGISVLDGNLNPPIGAKTRLFHATPDDSPSKSTPSTPDIVCSLASTPECQLVIDVKYKPDTDRNDLNQVLGYALTYRCKVVLLACPRKSASSAAGLHLLGEVSGIHVYHYFVDLAAPSLEQEEQVFVAAIRQLLITSQGHTR